MPGVGLDGSSRAVTETGRAGHGESRGDGIRFLNPLLRGFLFEGSPFSRSGRRPVWPRDRPAEAHAEGRGFESHHLLSVEAPLRRGFLSGKRSGGSECVARGGLSVRERW